MDSYSIENGNLGCLVGRNKGDDLNNITTLRQSFGVPANPAVVFVVAIGDHADFPPGIALFYGNGFAVVARNFAGQPMPHAVPIFFLSVAQEFLVECNRKLIALLLP